jgi:hypothetical protein
MNEVTWYDVFVENLYEKYPKKPQLVEELMKVLNIEREAVYRRLRKEVSFPMHEIIVIAFAWNISLDEIIGINSGLVPFHLQPINYLCPSKKEMSNLQKRVKNLEHFKISDDSEYVEVCNKFPRPLTTGFKDLYRLKIFNWAFLYNNDEPYIHLSDVVIPEKLTNEFEKYNKLIKHVRNTSFILDKNIFDYIVSNALYYHSILLITDEEKANIKKDLHSLLDYMFEIASTGCYPETKNKVNIYISHLKINTNYSCHYTNQLRSFRIHAFGKFDICTYEPTMVENFRTWMNLKRRASIQISEVNEKSRIEYFMKQRGIVDVL